MFCGQCGAEIRDGSAFCPKCGASQAANPGQGTAPQTMGNASLGQGTGLQALEAPRESGPAKEKGIPIGGIVAIAAAGLAAVIVVIASVFFLMPDRRNDEETRRNAVKETPLYSISDVAMVDLVTENRALGVKQPGMAWDSSLFYWLEDVDTTSPDDGYIAKCRVTKTLLRDALTQKLRQYEIYSDPDSGAIYKIVSVEETDGGVDLVDYYYRDGQPDFIFKREDTVYTPTYATPTKTGERYYFNSDVMVRWRIIREPGVIGEYVLAPREVNYSQADYYAESDELRSTYDETEKRMFHAACNTYDAIVAGGNIGLVQGVLCDTLGNGVEGKTVKVYRESDNVLLYEAATDVNGAYSFFVYLDGTPCYLKADGDELYRETLVQGVQFLQSAVNYSYGLTMHKNGGDEYPVMLHAYSCMDVVSDENETALGTPIQTVTATVREGAGNYRGESIRTVETQNGELVTNLPSGAYTVQLHAEGYLDSYMELEVGEDAAARDAYIMPGLAENQTGIVLTWDSDETDLDLTLFTPYQAANGDMAHIGGGVDRDSYGNILVSDNKSRCEAMLINSGEQGSYKLYVSNYTDSSAGNYSSDALYRINVHVYIYNSDGFLAEYTIPLGQSGVVWEVAEVNGRTVTPAQRVYADISGKSWWTGSKETWKAEEDAALLACLEEINNENWSKYGYLRNLLESLLCMSDEEVNMLCRGEKAGIERFFGLVGYLDSPADVLGYIHDNYSMHISQSAELNKRLGIADSEYSYGFLTKEQADYLISSICGKAVDFDFSTYPSWVEPYIGYSTPIDCPSSHLANISVERVSADTWKVRGYTVRILETFATPSPVGARVCFTVVKNPDSCFDGYSLTGFEVEEEAPTDWAQIYYDYLTKDPEGIAIIENKYGTCWQSYEYAYGLIYVDDDMVPEIYLQGLDTASGDILLYIYNGKVTEEYFSNYGGSYIPYMGLMKSEYGRMGFYGESIYRLENGRLVAIGGLDWHDSDMDPETGYPREDFNYILDEIVEVIDRYWLNETEVTKEQYDEVINSYVGMGGFQPCCSTYSSSLLEELECLQQQ